MKKTIVLFQQDLRLSDNPALTHAAARGEVIPLYVLDESIGAASRWWLHHSLKSLEADFRKHKMKLIIKSGDAVTIISKLIKETVADAVYWNRCYEPEARKKQEALKETFEAKSFNGSLLFEPWEISNKQGGFFKVFTPFWKHCLSLGNKIEEPLSVPKLAASSKEYKSETIESLKLLPTKPDWAGDMREMWKIGEKAAQEKLYDFLGKKLRTYPDSRNVPAEEGTSYLSPHLHFGEISARQIWAAARHHEAHEHSNAATGKFLSEIGWREFSYYLLYHLPNLPNEPFDPKFEKFEWKKNEKHLRAWQRGMTGYPIVDAGMRELWTTGYMHNRVRMIVASFLTKDLMIHWMEGAAWFWETLVDADLANNTASWQWVAGCGADASPYYRIFNPMLQGEKFDPAGEYVRRWVPELDKMPDRFIHKPWEADRKILETAKVTPGKTYPEPIVDHAQARAYALKVYKSN